MLSDSPSQEKRILYYKIGAQFFIETKAWTKLSAMFLGPERWSVGAIDWLALGMSPAVNGEENIQKTAVLKSCLLKLPP